MCRFMINMEVHEEDAGPGNYTHTSCIYVWHEQGQSWAFHRTASGVPKEDLRLGTITRIVYSTLETVGAVPESNGFLMLHFLPDSSTVDITMLPVGDDEKREKLDAELKAGGFGEVFSRVVDLCQTERADNVRILFNAHEDLGDASKLAIVHEINARVVPADVDQFVGVATGKVIET